MTTRINPVIWVLAGALLTLAVGRRFEGLPTAFIRSLASTPVLVLLLTASAVNLGARALVGHVAPGDFVQEVAAVRSFADRGEILLLWLALRSPNALGAAVATIAGIPMFLTRLVGPDIWWT